MERRKNAFTLMELLAVIVILSLILVLAIPSILNLTNNAKKESFYLYAQNLESKAISKYIQDMDDKTIKDTCMVYDIEKDLGLKKTGDYEGWIKLNRVVVPDPEKKQATIEITSQSPLTYVRYCINNGTTCSPDESLYIEENQTSAIVSEIIRTDQVLCAYYQYPEENELKTSDTRCVKFADAEDVVTDYTYDIILTIKSREYAVQDFSYSSTTDETTFKETFYNAIDSFNEISKKREENPMMISSPVCSGGEVTYKGTTTTATQKASEKQTTTVNPTCPIIEDDKKNFNIILNINGGALSDGVSTVINQCSDCSASITIPTPTRSGYIFDGWYYDKAFSKIVSSNNSGLIEKSPKLDSLKCIIGYNDVNLYAKWSIDPSSNTTSSTITTGLQTTQESNITTTRNTTIATGGDTTDNTILLESLSISGYNINFSPFNFSYEITIPFSQTSLEIIASPQNKTVSIVNITGNTSLSVGDNLVLVTVRNTTTNKANVYRILVSRLDQAGNKVTQQTQIIEQWDPESGIPDPSLPESNAYLEYLMLAGYTIDFDPNVYKYNLTVNSLENLLISYRPVVQGTIVSIEGNENLKDGSVIEIKTNSVNGYYSKTYYITIKYEKSTSENTKYLRIITIILLIMLISIIMISALKRVRGGALFKKKIKIKREINENVEVNSETNAQDDEVETLEP